MHVVPIQKCVHAAVTNLTNSFLASALNDGVVFFLSSFQVYLRTFLFLFFPGVVHRPLPE